jgi:hypothetical protein
MEKINGRVVEETNEYGLPTKVEIPFEEMYFDYFECEDGDEYKDDVIAEYLSDRYGFLNRSFRYEEDEDRKVIIVSEIDWEIDEEDGVVDEFYGLSEEQYNFIIDSFKQCLTGFTYDSWCDTGSKDKEEYVALATRESCPFEVDEGTIYDIFWDWAQNLEEDDFPEPEEDDEDDYFEQDFDDYEDEEDDHDDWY